MYNTIIGLFEDGFKASDTITEMLTAGVPRDSIRVMSNDPGEKDEKAGGGGKGFLSGIKGFLADIGILSEDKTHGVPEEHLNIYRDGIQGGKTLVMVVADQAWSPRVVEMMERHGALNIDDGSPDLAQSAGTEQPASPQHQVRGSSLEAYRGGVRVFPRSAQMGSPSAGQESYAQGQKQQGYAPNRATVQSVENQPGPVADQARRIVESRQVQGPHGITFESFEPDFRANYQSMLGGTGYPWDYYVPAYRYGFDLGAAPGWPSEWQQVEPYARDQWERHNPNTWDRFKDAVRYSWQRARVAMGAATTPSVEPAAVRDSVPGR